MKRLITIFALTAGLGLANAQEIKEAEVPSAVKESFKKEYPDAKAEKWEKDGRNYEAEFRKGMEESSVTFEENGTMVESKMKVNASELPQKANDYITQNVKGKKADEVWKVTDADGKVKYKAKVGEEKYIFSQDGTFIEKKQKSEYRDKSKEMDKDKSKEHEMHHENENDDADMKKDK